MIEVFPELCTIKLSDTQMTDNNGLTKRKLQSTDNTNEQQAQQQQPTAITNTVSRGKRWIFVLVVFVYLILSKLIARSTSASTS